MRQIDINDRRNFDFIRNDESSNQTTQILLYKDLDLIGQYLFSGSKITIGNGKAADLVLHDPRLGDIKAILHRQNGDVTISSLNGKPDVYLNGRTVKKAVLNHYDLIEIGSYSLKIQTAGIDAKTKGAEHSCKSRKQSPSHNEINGRKPCLPARSRHASTHPPYHMQAKSVSKIASQSIEAPAPRLEDNVFSDDFFTLPPYQAEAKSLSKSSKNSEKVFSGGLSNRDQRNKINHPQPSRPAERKSFINTGINDPDPSSDFLNQRCNLVFSGKLKPGWTLLKVKTGLNHRFGFEYRQLSGLVVGRQVILKRNITREKAVKLCHAFQTSGAICSIVPLSASPEAQSENKSHRKSAHDSSAPRPETKKPPLQPVKQSKSISKINTASESPAKQVKKRDFATPPPILQPKEKAPIPQAAPVQARNRLSISDFWANDEEETDFPAAVRLEDRLFRAKPKSSNGPNDQTHLEVIKTLNHSVVDFTFLGKGQKYFICNDAGKKIKLAENKGGGRCFYYLDQQIQATGESANGVVKTYPPQATSPRSFGLRSRRNRRSLKTQDCINISDGAFEYRLRQATPSVSPRVDVAQAEKSKAWRHMLHSAVFHVFLLLFMGLIPFSMTSEPTEPEPQFVQIDPDLLAGLQKPETPPKKIKLKPRLIEPVKPLETPPPTRKQPPKPAPKAKTIAKQKPAVRPKRTSGSNGSAKKTVASRADRHPNAGGGYGKGNVVNRDIKQVGLLSMIGDSVGIQPQTATAAVTNLDAVASPGAGENNFKVGGIAAKLGTGKVTVPSGGYVATKGSTQVLRSTGASGAGRVAALERGESGERKIKGMVSAQMTHKVNIQGGMSREAVKRVIDRHLDEISYCYETALMENPSIMGRITYEWKIKTSGNVGAVNIKSATINSHDIHACIKAAIRTWKFPPPQGAEVIVSYPFIFDIVGF